MNTKSYRANQSGGCTRCFPPLQLQVKPVLDRQNVHYLRQTATKRAELQYSPVASCKSPICHCEFTKAGSSSAVTACVQYPTRSKSYEIRLYEKRLVNRDGSY